MKTIKLFDDFILEAGGRTSNNDFVDNITDGLKLVKDIKIDIKDILIDFLEDSYITYSLSGNTLHLTINHRMNMETLDRTTSIDKNMLDDLLRLNSFILNEIGFKYKESYYFFNHKRYDIFKPGVSEFRWLQMTYQKV